MTDVEVTERRANWPVMKCSSFEEMRVSHIHAWQAVSSAERMKAAWDMVVEAWAMKKRDPDELRFQRSVTVIRKAQG